MFRRSFLALVPGLGWCAVAVVLTAAPASAGTTRCVNLDGSNGCATSLQATLDTARSGDVIEIAAGSYAPDVGDSIVVPTFVTIRGQSASATVIEAAVGVADSVVRTTISDLTVHGNVVAPLKTTLELRRCAIEYDAPPDLPFGVYAGVLQLEDCTVHGFPQRGVLVHRGTITRSTITGNGLGGIAVYERLRMTASTVSHNTAPTDGAGIFVDRGAGLSLADVTVSDNHALRNGGGIYVENAYITNSFRSPFANVRIERSTIAGNTAGETAGGLYSGVRSRVKLEASILADNSAPDAPDCHALEAYPARTRFGLVLESTDDCALLSSPGSPLLQADPLLGPLQDNGGATETRALLPGSPAIGVVTSSSSCRRPDQRGVARTVPCDLGAFEAP